MDNQQQVPNRQNSSKSSHWFAYCLAIAALAILVGILIKLIFPSPVMLNDNDQLKSISSSLGNIREQIKGVGASVAGVSSQIINLSTALPRETYTVRAIN